MSKPNLCGWTSLTHNRGMLTRDQLATMLSAYSGPKLAKESGVALKTIYRLREKKHSPKLDTVQALLGAMRRLNEGV